MSNLLHFRICPKCDSNIATRHNECPQCVSNVMRNSLDALSKEAGFGRRETGPRRLIPRRNPTARPNAANCDPFPQDAA